MQKIFFCLQFLDKGVGTVKLIFKDSVRRKLMTEDAVQRCLNNLKPTVDMQQLAGVDLVCICSTLVCICSTLVWCVYVVHLCGVYL